LPTSKGPPSSLVQLRTAVWTGDARDTKPDSDISRHPNNMSLKPLAPLPWCYSLAVTMTGVGQMRRREFLGVLGGAAAWPLAASAQQPGTPPIIGFMGSTTSSVAAQWVASFVQRLRELGWLEGRDVVIEYRWAEGRSERFAEITAEFVRLKVDVILTSQQSRPRR
jgi:hypothetical protein